MTKQATRLAMVVAIFAATAAFGQSDSQKAFDKLKTMVGTWEGVMPDGKTVAGDVSRNVWRISAAQRNFT